MHDSGSLLDTNLVERGRGIVKMCGHLKAGSYDGNFPDLCCPGGMRRFKVQISMSIITRAYHVDGHT